MADYGAITRKITALTLAVFVDLSLFYAAGFGEKRHSVYGNLARLWVVAVLRCLALVAVSLFTLGPLKPVLIRFIAVHSLLAAVAETGIKLLYGLNVESACGSVADMRSWLMCAGASLAAALFWELTIPDSNGEAAEKESKQKARVLFMRVLFMYKPDCALLLGAFVFLSLAAICEMSIPFYTGKVIDILGSQYQSSEFLSAVFFMGLYSMGGSLGAGCRGGLFLCAISSFTCRVKVMLFGALTKQEIGFFEAIKTGEITSRLSRDTTLMGRTVPLNINVLLRTFIKTVGIISLMMNLSWKLTFLVLMETPVTALLQNIYDTHYQEVQDSIARANEAVSEVVSSIRVVRSFKTEQGEARRYEDRLMDTHILKTRRDTVRAFVKCCTLIYIFGDMLNSVGAAGKVFEYLDREPQVSSEGTLAPDHLKGHVRFCDLTFSYLSHSNKTVLQDFSLELKPGQMAALVGPSGEGKSTCVSLLERFYEPQKGIILLDDQPLQSYEHRYLHRKIAVVSQQPVLFSGSIRENIAYGLTDCSLDEIQEAARNANAHDFIINLEKGYDTEVGEGGGQLSKSERQRIAIARALVRQPQILILDEITSSLDSESETKVQQALACNPNQTLLVIAHRLKTIENAHQIVVIGDGKVQECGTHQELMHKKGSYYKLREKLFTEANTP
uniref:Transporter associated with antigen processing, subunit type a n=1 Tax=Myripristis murdjan TaxID=586833 RepID=A0A667XSN4_9TELE